jgi:ABC-type transport system involved in multi-copper enzyme maturation permease subunit
MTPRSMRLLGGVVWLELLRRRDLGLLLTFTGILCLGVLGARLYGVENPQTGTFLLNLGLSWAWLGAHVLTVLLAARQLPQEIEQRTLHTLLARPVSRVELVLSKWLASALGGIAIFTLLLLPGWIVPPHLESYSVQTLLQALFAVVFSLSMVAALAVASSLWFPRAVAAVIPLLLFLFGGKMVAWAEAWSVGRGLSGDVVRWAVACIPDCSKFNLLTRYTDGLGPAPALDLVGLTAYGLIFAGFFMAISCLRFERMRI